METLKDKAAQKVIQGHQIPSDLTEYLINNSNESPKS